MAAVRKRNESSVIDQIGDDLLSWVSTLVRAKLHFPLSGFSSYWIRFIMTEAEWKKESLSRGGERNSWPELTLLAGDFSFHRLVLCLVVYKNYMCVVLWCFSLASQWEQHKNVCLAQSMSDNGPDLLDIVTCWSPCDTISVGSVVFNVSVWLSEVNSPLRGPVIDLFINLSRLFCELSQAPFWDSPRIIMVKYQTFP